MTNKQERAIKACKKLVAKYRGAESKTGFFSRYTCPLCKVYTDPNKCYGCPLANQNGGSGCGDFATYKGAEEERFSKKNFEARAQFFERIIPILEGLPEERFTKEGWKYTGDVIPRTW